MPVCIAVHQVSAFSKAATGHTARKITTVPGQLFANTQTKHEPVLLLSAWQTYSYCRMYTAIL